MSDDEDDDCRWYRWTTLFLEYKRNEYFYEIDEEYITDPFNLAYLNAQVHHFAEALLMILVCHFANPRADHMHKEASLKMRDTPLRSMHVTSMAYCTPDTSLLQMALTRWYPFLIRNADRKRMRSF